MEHERVYGVLAHAADCNSLGALEIWEVGYPLSLSQDGDGLVCKDVFVLAYQEDGAEWQEGD